MATSTRKFAHVLTAFMIAVGATSCSDATTPTFITGTYVLTQLTVSSNTVPATDLMVVGANGELTLAAGGVTSGRIFIPTTTATGPGATLDFGGQWTFDDDQILITTNTDTFLGNMPLSVQLNQLVGDKTFGNVRIQITFTR